MGGSVENEGFCGPVSNWGSAFAKLSNCCLRSAVFWPIPTNLDIRTGPEGLNARVMPAQNGQCSPAAVVGGQRLSCLVGEAILATQPPG